MSPTAWLSFQSRSWRRQSRRARAACRKGSRVHPGNATTQVTRENHDHRSRTGIVARCLSPPNLRIERTWPSSFGGVRSPAVLQ
jgi:hypothetical protein